MFTLATYNTFLIIMAAVAVVVFIALYFVEAGYGYLFNPKFGFPVPNRVSIPARILSASAVITAVLPPDRWRNIFQKAS